MTLWGRIRSLVPLRTRLDAVGAMQPVTTPTSRAVQKLKDFFQTDLSRHQLYMKLEELDPELASAINTAAMIVERCMKGFVVRPGKSLDQEEQALQEELTQLYRKLKPYIFDIARKLIRDGDAVYYVDVSKGFGIRNLTWLPIDQLTILENKSQVHRFSETIQEPNLYVLNEVPIGNLATQYFKADQVVHFNWGKQEKIRDRFNRWTLGIYNYPPLESLSTDIIWKFAIKLNDMLWREVNVPREHHKLPSAPFDPSLFSGATYEERLQRAQEAAEKALKDYVDKLEKRRVDRGYVTLDNVDIEVVEPKLQYTSPNELLRQINEATYGSIGTPESAVSGRARGTYASEIAVESYLLLKSEFLAGKIAEKFIELAKRHLDVKYGKKYQDHYHKIDFDVQLIFFPREMARTVAILRETGLFTFSELRALFGYPPLTEEQKADLAKPLGHRFTETSREIASSGLRRERPERPETPESTGQRQLT